MMHQCSVFTTKAQYVRSIILFENILSLDSTREALGLQCIDAIQVLMNKLVGKERHLAYHIRRHANMSLDAMTTSAVESMNFVTKKKLGLNSNMNISRALTGMAEEHDDRYICHRQNSMRLLGKINRSSQCGRPSQQQRTNAYKDILADVKLILDNPKCTKDDLVTMTMAVSKVKDEIMEKGRREDGEKQYGTRLVWGDDNDKKRSPQKRNLGPCG